MARHSLAGVQGNQSLRWDGQPHLGRCPPLCSLGGLVWHTVWRRLEGVSQTMGRERGSSCCHVRLCHYRHRRTSLYVVFSEATKRWLGLEASYGEEGMSNATTRGQLII